VREDYFARVKDAVGYFRTNIPKGMVRIISHLDSDGICSSALLAKALSRENLRYSITIVPQLDERTVISISEEPHELFIFSDLGSTHLGYFERYMRGRAIIVLDHHQTTPIETEVMHVNPHLFGLNGSEEIAGSGVVYHFVEALNPLNRRLSHIALIGAVGDNQERKGFKGLNAEILKIAEEEKLVQVSQGLRLFGVEGKPLHKVLEYSFDPFIPGVSGSESGTLDFLQSLGIQPKTGTAWKRLTHLTAPEKKRLVEGIIIKRAGEENPADIFGTKYTLINEPEGPYRDVREFSTLLNACGRLGRASVGIAALLDTSGAKKGAASVLADYRKEILNAMRWVNDNKKSGLVFEDEGYILINAQHHILPTMAGTIASMISKSHEIKNGTFVMSLARTDRKKTKVSLRISGRKAPHWIDLKSIIAQIVAKVGGEAGGHRNAAGAIIDATSEDQFISIARQVLKKQAMMESI
jgi:single-stranded-DNA-specific exonuclease